MTTDIKEFNPQEVERLKRNLRETSMNEGSVDLACRCADSLTYIEQLEGQLSAAMSGWKQNVEELKTQLSTQAAEPVAWLGYESTDKFPWVMINHDHPDVIARKNITCYTHPPVIQTAPDVLAEQFKRAIAGPQPPTERPSLIDALDRYEAQTEALPLGHEIRDRGYSAYNWQMAAIRDIRALLKERP